LSSVSLVPAVFIPGTSLLTDEDMMLAVILSDFCNFAISANLLKISGNPGIVPQSG
jgi:hypothetical protein